MGHRQGRARIARALLAAIVLAVAPPAATRLAAGPLKVRTFAAGLGYEFLARTAVWGGDATPSGFQANLMSARADLGFSKGVVVSLSAGLTLTDVTALTFNGLPISLQYNGAPLPGFAFGAEALVPVRRFSDFEISGTARFVYSFGMKKTWPLEGFAVEGRAEGTASWMEAAIGPRIAYHGFGRVLPFLEISCRWFHAGFAMRETLDDLAGRETKGASRLSAGVALGAEAELSGPLSVKARAGIVPCSGGVDGLFTAGLLYKF
jgi:hypothetical protein